MLEAYRANALFDAHGDGPEFGYPFFPDEAADPGQVMAERTEWRIWLTNDWVSTFGQEPKRGKGPKVGPPVHGDFVQGDFTVTGTNELWLADMSEHRKLEC